MAKRKDELIFLQNHIRQTNEQGQQLEQIIERMLDMEDRVENRVSYVEEMVEEIKKKCLSLMNNKKNYNQLFNQNQMSLHVSITKMVFQ
ncbi:hypothetical protein [Staphylococcus pseudintermedius]|uniref:hypothetical protein n=1 Tax=Staphylococcus pseudintermedius TaxID=283734 RepID=UPI001F50920F|nr:hypothetical protein [Staphylococcus pseudintermedius]